ncbi:MAG: T9SS type A sorting domain-containing protein [Chitinophagaceae bacterium]
MKNQNISLIFDMIGTKLREEKVNGRTLIQMRGLLPGTYLVSFILNDNRVYETKKLIVY